MSNPVHGPSIMPVISSILPAIPYWLLVIVLLGGISPAAQAECQPPLTGAPCAQGGIATLHHTEPSLNLAAGNPIHLVTGNNFQTERDLPASAGLPGLELVRHYNSLDARHGTTGTGWVLSYDTRLHRVAPGWQIVQADGSRVSFPASSEEAGVFKSRHGELRKMRNSYYWDWPGGALLEFDEQGWLISLHQPGNATVVIQRHPPTDGARAGLIRQVVNQFEQHMDFDYVVINGRAQLSQVSTPLGTFQYEHDTHLRLTRLTRPDGMQRHYLYEPEHQAGHSHLLTGIGIANRAGAAVHRLNTWHYDRKGRAVHASRGPSDRPHSQVTLQYVRAPARDQTGVTRVHNAAGQATQFETTVRGGQHVLLRVEGSGCPGCARPGTRAHYDGNGRLTAINNVSLSRHADGSVRQLQATHQGWPGLQLDFRPDGRRTHWHSKLTGTETMQYNADGQPVQRMFANGDTQQYTYDVHGRPQTVIARHAGRQAKTTLQWQGTRIRRIDHPAETEQREYDAHGRLAAREVTRHCFHQRACLTYQEQFDHDDNGRLIRHQLPEGGALQYEWDPDNRISSIHWTDPHGKPHPILTTVAGQPGYRYGNGLHLHTEADDKHQARRLVVSSSTRTVLEHYLEFDAHGRIQAERTLNALPDARRISPHLQQHLHRYAHNDEDQLIISQTAGRHPGATATSAWLAWQDGGRLAARREDGVTHQPAIRRDASGLALTVDGVALGYSAERRLQHVVQDGRELTRYAHNAFGHRILQQAAGHRGEAGWTRHFFYVNNQLVAESDLPVPGSLNKRGDQTPPDTADSATDSPADSASGIKRRFIYAHHVPVAMIEYASGTQPARLYFIHADLIGTPRLVTDTNQHIRWQADYSALGKATLLRGDIRLDMRFAGQVADAVTGWHDNLLRTYHPGWGQYLEPDPLGPLPVTQAFGYAAQQPRRHVDPHGLLLFAFDGTRQSASTQSNVWKLSQHYLDGPVYYHPGPGDSHRLDLDAITASSADDIIESQWKALLNELAAADMAETIPIDILGFSRGAALARHFGNRVANHVSQGLLEYSDAELGTITACVDLRFMGLFDSVAQFGLAGSRNHLYDLAIPAAWDWVAHAAALQEHRLLFPLLSATENGHTLNIVEAPFVGAHSDIGGGILPADRPREGHPSDLSNVALNWMLWQARAASVRFAPLDPADRVIERPVLHNYRSVLLRRAHGGDRAVQSPDGQEHLMWQEEHPHLGQKQRDQTETFITRPDGWPTLGGIEVGTVEMDAYARWLHDELGWQAPPV